MDAVATRDWARDPGSGSAYLDAHGLVVAAGGSDSALRNCANAKKNDILKEGYVEGHSANRKRKVVEPLDAPRLLVAVLGAVAAPALRGAQLLQALTSRCRADAENARFAIEAALAFVEGGEQDRAVVVKIEEIFGGSPRYRRVSKGGGSILVFAAIDLVVLARKCGYDTAKATAHRIFKDYFGVDVESEESNLLEKGASCTFFQQNEFWSIQFSRGRPTVCLEVEAAVELLLLVPQSNISAAHRRHVVETYVGVQGGDLRLIDTILSKRRFQEYLEKHDPEHPLRAFGERAEASMSQVLVELRESRAAALQTQKAVSDMQRALVAMRRAQRVQGHLVRRGQIKQRQKWDEALAEHSSIGTAVRAAVASAVLSPTGALVAALRSAVKRPARKRRHLSQQFPPEQQATPEDGVLATTLAAVAKSLAPSLSFGAWRSVRSAFGRACKEERLRRHGLGPEHRDYVPRPLLWTSLGPSVPGGGARYLYVRSEEAMISEVWRNGFAASPAVVRPNEQWPVFADEIEPAGACDE